MTKGFLDFIDEHERKLENYLTEEKVEVKPIVKKLIQKPGVKPTVAVKQSNSFSFCTSCGVKIGVANAKYCPACGKPTVMTTDGKTKVASKNVSEDVSYANALMDEDSTEVYESRIEKLLKNVPKNPIMEMLKGNHTPQSQIRSSNGLSEAAEHASDLLGDEEPTVQGFIPMPDFSQLKKKFGIEEPKQVINEAPTIPMVDSNLNISDPAILSQMSQLGLV